MAITTKEKQKGSVGMEKQRSSKKQQELLQFIDNFIKGNGYGPSYREIMRGLGYKSVSTVAVHVDGLITKGYLRKKDHSARSIEVVTLQYAETAPQDKSNIAWLEREIEARIATNEAPEQVTILIDAAVILGSKKAESLRQMRTDS